MDEVIWKWFALCFSEKHYIGLRQKKTLKLHQPSKESINTVEHSMVDFTGNEEKLITVIKSNHIWDETSKIIVSMVTEDHTKMSDENAQSIESMIGNLEHENGCLDTDKQWKLL